MNVAAPQPKITSAATAKTNPSESPFASAPSTGTGNRSARIEATRNAATPAIVPVEPGSRKNENVAARYAATPTSETGATTASSRDGGSALLIQMPLPGEVREFPGEVAEHDRERDEQGDQGKACDLRVPLKHERVPPT